MTSLLASRRRAEDFARLVEGSRRRPADPGLAPLQDLVALLRPAPVEPSDAFRAALRERLVSAAADTSRDAVPAGVPIPAMRSAVRTPNRLRIAAVALSVALAGGMAGTAAAARGAQPGEMLYPLKLGLERTEVAVASNPESRGHHYLKQAMARLSEAHRLADGVPIPATDRARVRLARTTLNEFTSSARDGAELLVRAHQIDRSPAPINGIHTFVADARPRLSSLRGFLPTPLADSFAAAVATLDDLDQRAVALCPRCVEPAPGHAPRGVPERRSREPQPAVTVPTGRTESPEGSPSQTMRPGKFPKPTNPGPGLPLPRRTDGSRLPLPHPSGTIELPKPGPSDQEPTPLPTLPLPTLLPLPLPTLLPLPLPTLLPLPLPWPQVADTSWTEPTEQPPPTAGSSSGPPPAEDRRGEVVDLPVDLP
ncbi:DUF5667 domain-containing protein [Actinopolymorpha pittospori]|uniref:DUF5667 domain-containing protein n=1 Tax=Actinopolymorpha pittospori TaxID=648752 RepID=A0A927R9S7_9ACTN|nr:DUF5667 domain-containing protein [Actinopolymorpha pittospori]MBE1606814.1 hypothetical protein [Actinopolymorpha pittospori]